MQTKNLSMSPEFSGFLDFVRWVAALLVVLQHIRYLWFAEYVNVQNKSLLIKSFYFFTGFGSEAVLVFFVLSGFLVGGGALRKWQAGTYSATDYFISRFSRIYIVLLPALILGGLLDWVGLQYFNSTEIYTNSPSFHTKSLDFYISNNLNWSTFFANLANLQGILTNLQGDIIKQFGSNGPLWSLAYECWYYCLFALILELFGKRCTGLDFWVLVVIALSALILLPVNLLLFMVVWGVGAWAAIIDPKHLKSPPPPYIGCVLFILLLIGSRLSHILLDGYMHDFIVSMTIRMVRDISLAIGFSLLIISLRNMRYPVVRSLTLHKLMADFSFTIYLLHVPLLVFITAILSSHYGMSFFVQPTLQVFVVTTIILLVIYVVLYGFSLVTERYTSNVKRYLTKLISLNQLEGKAGRI